MKKYKDDHHSSFAGIERRVLFRCPEWRALSLRAKIIYLYLKGKYSRIHNGQIQLCFSEVSEMPGFASKKGFYGACRELEVTGWVERTNPGGLYRNPNTYRLTGKFDALL